MNDTAMNETAKKCIMYHFTYQMNKAVWTGGLLDCAAVELDREDFEALQRILVKMNIGLRKVRVTSDNIHWSRNAPMNIEVLDKVINNIDCNLMID